MYTAKYLPSLRDEEEDEEEDPTKAGFETEELAWEHVFTKMCKGCKEERQLALDGKKFPDEEDQFHLPNLYPACSCEWVVGLTEELDRAESFEDVLRVGGFKKVWSKETDKTDKTDKT